MSDDDFWAPWLRDILAPRLEASQPVTDQPEAKWIPLRYTYTNEGLNAAKVDGTDVWAERVALHKEAISARRERESNDWIVTQRDLLLTAPMEMRFVPPKPIDWVARPTFGMDVFNRDSRFRIVTPDGLTTEESAELVRSQIAAARGTISRYIARMDEKARRRRMKRARRKRIRARGWA